MLTILFCIATSSSFPLVSSVPRYVKLSTAYTFCIYVCWQIKSLLDWTISFVFVVLIVSLIVLACSSSSVNVITYRDIILSDKPHYSLFRPFRVTTAGSTVLAAFPFCRELGSMHCSSVCCS